MGQSQTKLRDAFAKDGFTLTKEATYKNGYGARAETKSIRATDVFGVLNRQGPKREVAYVSGSPYEMGYLIARLFPQDVEDMCTLYIEHMPVQFISESFDVTISTKAPLLHRTVYEALLAFVNDILVNLSVKAFWKAVERGDIPAHIVEEMRGIVAGCKSVNLVTPVTLERVIASNYGLDYVMMLILSGKIAEMVQKTWNKLTVMYPSLPKFSLDFFVTPDMCNGAIATGPATASGNGAFLLRDFQFQNSQVFHRTCTIIIRKPEKALTSAVVAMPGMIGCVTGLNEKGLACGLNMVRSGAVDTSRLGMGAMIAMRELLDHATNVNDMEQSLRNAHLGCPWIVYGVDKNQAYRVFECFAAKYDSPESLAPSEWVKPDLPLPKTLSHWMQNGCLGVWPRTEQHHEDDDAVLRKWSEPLLRKLGHPELAERTRWMPDGFLYISWHEELKTVHTLSTFYFPPWRPVGTGVCVINNSFLNPVLRVTQMSTMASLVERVACGNQWRFDTLTGLMKESYGKMDFDTAKEIITFLSPWKRPDYPQNVVGITKMEKTILKRATPLKLGQDDITITGAISVVDCTALRIANKNGYWGDKFYEIHLENYLNVQ